MSDWSTPPQLAAEWKCKPHAVLKFISSGELEAFDISHNPGTGRPRWRIHRDAVKAFEQRRSATAQADAKRELRSQRRRRRRDRAARNSAKSHVTDNATRMEVSE